MSNFVHGVAPLKNSLTNNYIYNIIPLNKPTRDSLTYVSLTFDSISG